MVHRNKLRHITYCRHKTKKANSSNDIHILEVLTALKGCVCVFCQHTWQRENTSGPQQADGALVTMSSVTSFSSKCEHNTLNIQSPPECDDHSLL